MELKIAISGINAVDNPGPGIGVAKSIKEDKDLKTKIIGLAYDAMEPGIYMNWIVDKSFLMPYPSSGYEAYIERLLYIKKNYGLDFVLPVLDVELPLYIKYQKDLENYGIKTFLPTFEQFNLRSKDKLENVAKNIGISTPKTIAVSSLDELSSCIQEIGLPVMIKGAFYKAYKANSLQEAVSYYSKVVAEWGYPVIVQQVVFGEEMNVVAGGDGEGNSLGMVGIKKSWITELGKIWTGITIKNENLLNAAKSFIEVYKWKGAFELECIVNMEINQIFLIEINPRFPAWSYFSTGVGVNIASNIVRKAFNLPIRVNDYEAGKLYIRYTDDFVINMDKFQQIIVRGEV